MKHFITPFNNHDDTHVPKNDGERKGIDVVPEDRKLVIIAGVTKVFPIAIIIILLFPSKI